MSKIREATIDEYYGDKDRVFTNFFSLTCDFKGHKILSENYGQMPSDISREKPTQPLNFPYIHDGIR